MVAYTYDTCMRWTTMAPAIHFLKWYNVVFFKIACLWLRTARKRMGAKSNGGYAMAKKFEHSWCLNL